MKRMILNALFIASLALLGVRSASAVMIDFVPVSHNTGDPVFFLDIVLVDVVISDLNGEVVSAYDLDITYDDGLLAPWQVVYHDNLGDWFLLETLREDSAPFSFPNDGTSASPSGILDVAELSFLTDAELLALQGGNSVSLFTMDFDVIADGIFDMGAFAPIWDADNDVKGANNRVILPVPEPGTLFLMTAAVAGLGWSRRKRA